VDPADDSTLSRLEDQLLGGERTMSLPQLAERAGMPVEAVRLFWQAMGLATADVGAPAFTDADAAVLARLGAAAQENELGRETAISLVRSVGHLTDRLVLWQAEAVVEHLMVRHSLDDTSARLVFLDRLSGLAPLLEAELVHAWRRQMAALAARFVEDFAAARDVPTDALPLARAVGFADVVSFTIRTAGMPAGELARFVQRFEERSRDVVAAAGGRVVKTIGDAVLFVADDLGTGAEVALGLAAELGASSVPVRVGLVWGRILSRFGDVFGAPVNLAARLTAEADPGTVLTDAATADALAGDPRYRGVTQAERDVAGLGPIRPVRLDRA
jgi:adenylate cyclase